MNILFICCYERYKCINKTYWDIVNNYKKYSKFNIEIVYTDYNMSQNEFNKFNPNIVVFFDIDTPRSCNKFKFVFQKPVYLCSLDYFYFKIIINDQYIKRITGLITFPIQKKIMNSYKEIFPDKKYLSFGGRFINSNIYKNYNLQKKYDILIYGSRGNRSCGNLVESHNADKEYKKEWEEKNKKTLSTTYCFYPLRIRLEELLLKNKEKYNLCILPDGGSITSKKYVNESLSKLINKSWLVMCTRSRADILMDKFIEVSASYSAILGNIPSDYEELFKENIVEVTEWMSDDEILTIIDKALEDKQRLWEMTKRLGDRIHEEYNLSSAVKNMDSVFDDISKNV